MICHEKLYCHPPFGITSRCRISVKGGEYVVNILMKEVEKGRLQSPAAVSDLLEKYSSKSKLYKFCPGLDVSQYEQYKDIIRFDVKSLRKTDIPSYRLVLDVSTGLS